MRETKIYQLSNNDIAITLQETMAQVYTWTFLDKMGGKNMDQGNMIVWQLTATKQAIQLVQKQ